MLKPLPAEKWNEAAAAHLYNRAGFGGTPNEIRALAAKTPDEAVSFFVDFEKIPEAEVRPDWAHPDPVRNERVRQLQQMTREVKNSSQSDEQKQAAVEKLREAQQQIRREQNQHMQQLRGDWLQRMAVGPRPFQEKLTLFWHGHFATSAVKVREAYFMWLQVETFRRMGTGPWIELLEAVAQDPAMLIWLDQAQSRQEHPNENFARESMELFVLGEGHYTEKDVTEAARAMTGWSLDRIEDQYRYRPGMHDTGIKTVLGRTGPLTGRQVLEVMVEQPQAARFITTKLWKFFASDDPSPELIDDLAETFREHGQIFKPFLRAMFRSEAFYADSVMRSQIKSPVQWLAGSIRLLQRPPPPPIVMMEMTRNLGQELLAPPNVKGWDGGLSWITTNTLLDRYNQAGLLVEGQGNLGARGQRPTRKMAAAMANAAARDMAPIEVKNIVADWERHDPATLISALKNRFVPGQLSEEHRDALDGYLAARADLTDQDIRHVIRLLMSTPEYQIA